VSRARARLAALASGVLLAASFPPWSLHPLAWIALVPLLLALRGRRSAGEAFARGWLAGFVEFALATWWLRGTLASFTTLPGPVVTLLHVAVAAVLGAYTGLFALGTSRAGMGTLWLAPACWVATEWLRGAGPLGFPWLPLGTSQPASSGVAQLAEVTGVAGVSAVLVLANAALADALSRGRWRRLAVAGLVIAATVLGGHLRLRALAGTSPAGALRLGLVTGHVEQQRKWDPSYRETILAQYETHTRALLSRRPDAIVWPETATPFYLEDDPGGRYAVERLARAAGVPLVFGSPAVERRDDGAVARFNRVYLVDGTGAIAGRYDKQVLVPFGEYVPFARWLPGVRPIVDGGGAFVAGRDAAPFVVAGVAVGPLLCYESALAAPARRLVGRGARVLLNLSNDGWFARTAGPEQALRQAAFRAVELRVPLVRVANSGVSAVIGVDGRTLWRPPPDAFGADIVDVHPSAGLTIYARLGDWFVATMLALIVVAGIIEGAGHLGSPAERVADRHAA
jgi:apolipoprotein N-acyltransferase